MIKVQRSAEAVRPLTVEVVRQFHESVAVPPNYRFENVPGGDARHPVLESWSAGCLRRTA
ncbi:hypothetical protein HCB17_07300 [Salinispora arenicola]|uniref:hypothetical protein n=1 Tax=Salinispora arenicola TaxID=168697 RepID=UPI00142F45F8|nr:hypothetical protein [Salinispora arenicola]NIL40998.1 hypothetical protein [Salinispora arenicola]